jgi:peptide/nickel transport system substrate-binding protein
MAANLQLPGQLAHPIFGIRAPGSDPFQGEHIGSGPFRYVAYAPRDRIIVERYPDYWATVPPVDGIEFRFMPDHSARVAALQAQEVDVIYSVPLEAAAQLSGAAHIRILPSKVGAYQGLGILLSGQHPHDITQDISVRKAIGYAVDRGAIVRTAFGGFATASQTLIPAAVLGPYAERIAGYAHRPEMARSLLEEAGWRDADGDGIREKDGRRLSLTLVTGYPTATVNRGTPDLLRSQLAEVGIEVRIEAVAREADYEERLRERRGDLWLEIGNQNSASPCFLPGFLYYGRDGRPNIWQSAFAPGLAGWTAFDDAIDGCNTTPDAGAAALHAAEAMHVLVDEARVVVPLVGLYRIWFTSDAVQDLAPHPVYAMIRWNTVSVTR